MEVDENGDKKIVKIVDGVESEITEDELKKMDAKHPDGEKVIIKRRRGGKDKSFSRTNEDGENVKIKVVVDEEGNVSKTKWVNGEEQEFTEDDLKKMSVHEKGHRVRIIEKDTDNEWTQKGEGEQRVEIKVEVNENGEKTIVKTVNGVEEELTEEELKRIESMHKGEGARIMIKEIESEENDGTDVKARKHRTVDVFTTDGKDFTLVLIDENYDPNHPKHQRRSAKINSLGAPGELEVYPNPSEGVFTVSFEQNNKVNTSIVVTDISGKTVYTEQLGDFSGKYKKEINLNEFGSGTYLINVQSGKDTKTTKVIVK